MPEQEPPDGRWLAIEDFTPGCYSAGGAIVGNTVDRRLGAPLGAADAEVTYGCYALPNKALAALPGVTHTYAWPGASSGTHPAFLVGCLIHDELADGTTEAIVISEYDDGANHHWQAYSFILESLATNLLINTTEATSAGIFGSPYPQFTRAANTNPTTTPGNPVAVFPVGGPASPTNVATGQLYMYPDPATPSAFGVRPLITGPPYTSVSGQTLVHQSRVVVLAGVNYSYPAGGGFDTNENINFTDPPNSTVYGNQQTVLAAEEPYGYGCGGSISAGELFIVKKRGGGLVVTGDIFAPNVTFLPGVQPTGNFYGNAASTPMGFVYCSYDNGAWVWNGGSTSQKLSSNLDDGAFLPPEFLGTGGAPAMQSNNYGFYVSSFGDKVYFSNNWLYNTRDNSWWTYYPRPNNGGANLFWVQPVNGNFIYAAQLSFTGTNTFLYRFDPATPSQNYQWQSLPLKLASPDHVSDIREVVIRASNSSAGATLTLTVLDQGSAVWGPTTMTGTIGSGPQLIRYNVAANGVREPQVFVQVAGFGGGDMPVIHGIDIRYRTRAHQAVTD